MRRLYKTRLMSFCLRVIANLLKSESNITLVKLRCVAHSFKGSLVLKWSVINLLVTSIASFSAVSPEVNNLSW